MSEQRSVRSGAQGFTLVEVMVTLVILSFGLLTLALVQLQAMRQGSQGRHTGDGMAIARSYLEQASRVPWSELEAAKTAGGWQDPGWDGIPSASVLVNRPGGESDTTEHSYTVQWSVDAVSGTSCLLDVQVSVQWDEDGRSTPKTHVLGTRRFNAGASGC
ncbi:MAG TPA: prepilin-type N-terminal cleavage/methylation domain-containing protein [Myxococcota bacterium]|nr:prepilin-type N-terminal cleavage/methylation domain-containing protein [Myxococcota bacterium]